MVDNVTTQSSVLATPPAATVVATDEVAGVHHQKVKLTDGADGGTVGIPGNAGGLHVQGGKGTLTDGSGNIAAAGVSEQVFAANSARRYLMVQNVSETDMWLDFGTPAVADQPSFLLLAGGGGVAFEGSFIPTSTVNILCSVMGEPYTAKEA